MVTEYEELKNGSDVVYRYEPIFPRIGHWGNRFLSVRKYHTNKKLTGPKGHMIELSIEDLKNTIAEIESTHVNRFVGAAVFQFEFYNKETKKISLASSCITHTGKMRADILSLVKDFKKQKDVLEIISTRLMIVW